MKSLKLFSVFTFMAVLAFTSCKNEGATDETRESLATTSTTADVTSPPVNNNATTTTPVPAGPITTIEFEETTFDFGEVSEGEKVVHIYKFENTGSEPLIISKAKGTCGCTVPEWPKEPIPPGAFAEIKVEFDTKGKGSVEGKAQSKRVTITANTDPVNTYITIKGKVVKTETPNS